jgi:menaquinone-dependent protoporphyrinogen oxidase
MHKGWIIMKTLIVYGTRYGATASTSEEIGKVLREDGFVVDVLDLKKNKVKNISEYEVVIVGSGLRIFRWTKEPEKFLKKFRKELREKKLAIFVSSGAQEKFERDGLTEEIENAWQKYLVEKKEKYELEPVLMGIHGGVWDFNKMGFFAKTMQEFKHELIASGIEETEPDVFDTRNWDEIRNWAKELAMLVRG